MFASQTTQTITISTRVVSIRKLNWKALGKAAQAVSDAAMEMAARMPQMADRWRQAAAEQQEKAPPAHAPNARAVRLLQYQSYDKAVVLHSGISSISGVAVVDLPAAIDDFDDSTADQLHRAILDLSLPPIDAAAEEQERKND